MFYPVESYDQNNSTATRTCAIYTEPQHGNSGNHPEITLGWLGMTNDWYRQALGEFETLDDAVAAIAEEGFTVDQGLPDYDSYTSDGLNQYVGDDSVVAIYRTVGDAREQWNPLDWFNNEAPPVTADTTDAEIDALAAQLESEANNAIEHERPYGGTLVDLTPYLQNLRDEARADAT